MTVHPYHLIEVHKTVQLHSVGTKMTGYTPYQQSFAQVGFVHGDYVHHSGVPTSLT